MYTLGTSAIKYIAGMTETPAIRSALLGKYCAFVGTEAERVGTVDQAGVQRVPYVVFIQMIDNTRDYDLYEVVTNEYNQYVWQLVNVGAAQHLDKDMIVAAASIVNSAYVFQRGPEARRTVAKRVAGAPYFATDTNTLYVFNGQYWAQIGGADSTSPPIGTMIVFAEGIAKPVPRGWTRCDGREESARNGSPFYALAQVCGNAFGFPSTPDKFVLPLQDNYIIRYSYEA